MSGSRQPEWTISATVGAPAGETWKALIHSFPGLSKKADEISDGRGVQHVTAAPEGADTEWNFEVDAERRVIGLQGSWWYRGEHAVVSDGEGSMVVYRVFNIAPGGTRWLVPLMERGGADRLKGEFRKLVSDIGNRLNCRTDFLDG